MTFEKIINDGKRLTEAKLASWLQTKGLGYDALINAMKYSVDAGGKRIRPSLLLEFYRLCGGKDFDSAVNFAAAIECIHTYSLIHDDLPCMDNDDMRRGKPSCHIAHGEDTALLAGDGLLTLAFQIASEKSSIEPQYIVKAINRLAGLAGMDGMVGGQVIDLEIENKTVSLETVKRMYLLKTGALIRAAAEIGVILAGKGQEYIDSASEYAECIGLAFQIEDDILDIESTDKELGKPTGSDSKNDKCTYVSLVGIKQAKKDIVTLTNKAVSALTPFGDGADGLISFADKLSHRKN